VLLLLLATFATAGADVAAAAAGPSPSSSSWPVAPWLAGASLRGLVDGLYDCQGGVPSSWPIEQQEWCCLMKQVNCPSSLQVVPPMVRMPLPPAPSTTAVVAAIAGEAALADAFSPQTAAPSPSPPPLPTTTALPPTTAAPPPPTTTTTATATTRTTAAAAVAPSPPVPTSTPPKGTRDVSAMVEEGWYDCSEDLWYWKTKWSDEKKDWCCSHELSFCPTFVSTTTPAPFDCEAGSDSTWPDDKREWCCRHAQVGCSIECRAICVVDGVTASCADRVLWAKTHQFSGEETACPHAHRLVLQQCVDVCSNCAAERVCDEASLLGDWESASTTKSASTSTASVATSSTPSSTTTAHAPTATGAAMTTTTTTSRAAHGIASAGGKEDLYDCIADFGNWKHTWSESQRRWCCKHYDRGCDGRDDGVPEYDCTDDYLHWADAWSPARARWCCESNGRGCPLSSSGAPAPAIKLALPELQPISHQGASGGGRLGGIKFDCTVGLPGFWPQTQSAWCCVQAGQGCSEAAFDCRNGVGAQQWSDERNEWCCDNLGRGCAAQDGLQPFDCADGASSSGWSRGKRAWCCLYKQEGCGIESAKEPPTAPAAGADGLPAAAGAILGVVEGGTKGEGFQCDDGLFDGRQGWSAAKKAWCCHYGVAAVRRVLENEMVCSGREQVGSSGAMGFQRKSESQLAGVGMRLRKMLGPTSAAVITFMVICGFIRLYSRALPDIEFVARRAERGHVYNSRDDRLPSSLSCWRQQGRRSGYFFMQDEDETLESGHVEACTELEVPGERDFLMVAREETTMQ